MGEPAVFLEPRGRRRPRSSWAAIWMTTSRATRRWVVSGREECQWLPFVSDIAEVSGYPHPSDGDAADWWRRWFGLPLRDQPPRPRRSVRRWPRSAHRKPRRGSGAPMRAPRRPSTICGRGSRASPGARVAARAHGARPALPRRLALDVGGGEGTHGLNVVGERDARGVERAHGVATQQRARDDYRSWNERVKRISRRASSPSSRPSGSGGRRSSGSGRRLSRSCNRLSWARRWSSSTSRSATRRASFSTPSRTRGRAPAVRLEGALATRRARLDSMRTAALQAARVSPADGLDGSWTPTSNPFGHRPPDTAFSGERELVAQRPTTEELPWEEAATSQCSRNANPRCSSSPPKAPS